MKKISFFSYKGGAGRSITAANVIPFLSENLGATKDNPILLLDMDFDSAGLTYFFDQAVNFRNKNVVNTKAIICSNNINYSHRRNNDITPSQQIVNDPLFSNSVPIGNFLGLPDDRSVLFFGVNDEPKIVDLLNINAIDANKNLSNLVTSCMNIGFSAIILDSASGDQLPAQISILRSDTIVICMRPTIQFTAGTIRFLYRKSSNNELENKHIILLPTAVPTNSTNHIHDASLRLSTQMAGSAFGRIGTLDNSFLQEKSFGIPEIEHFKWQEDILYKLNQKEEYAPSSIDELALERYKMVADVL